MRMNEFISRKMDEIFTDFQREIQEEYLCQLKDFRFDRGNIPNYNEEIMQQFYLLKYLPAYLTEYYCIYTELINENFLGTKINVLSIGAGCGIDFWGLKFAFDESEDEYELSYRGIDAVEWGYQEDFEELNYQIDCIDLGQIETIDDHYNIIIFPKSIGEFDDTTFENFLELLKNTTFSKKKLVILSSLIKTRVDWEISRVIQIVNVLEEHHGYKCKDNPNQYRVYEKNVGEEYRFEEICDTFYYPPNIKKFILELNSHCQGYEENDSEPCNEDCTIMNRHPIIKTSLVNFQILKFIRE
jgi:hypothetical protein